MVGFIKITGTAVLTALMLLIGSGSSSAASPAVMKKCRQYANSIWPPGTHSGRTVERGRDALIRQCIARNGKT